MSERRKLDYELALVEIVGIEEVDILTTSGWENSTDQVDKDENSWVPLGGWN
jgi:hypothetical protein